MFDFAPYLAMSVIMGCRVYSIHLLLCPSNIVLLVFQVLTGVSLHAAMNCIFKTSAFSEVVDFLKDALRPRMSQFAFLKLKLRKQ